MKMLPTKVLILTLCFYLGNCGNVVVNYSPPSLRFGSAPPLHLSNLDDVLAATLGYTWNDKGSFIWSGLTVTSPFDYPKAVVVLGVKDGGAPIRLEGTLYNLKEDSTLENAYDDLTSLIGHNAQRPIEFLDIPASDLAKKTSPSYTIPEPKVLDSTKDSEFLKEMSVLPNLADFVKPNSSVSNDGQDIVFVNIDSFASLVERYNGESEAVKEASTIFRSSLAQTIARLEQFYSEKVVVVTAMLSNSKQNHIRKRRAIGDQPTEVDYNLGAVYSEDYPVIFNIVLLIGVVLTAAIIATSMSIAFMDPGRDSIIYRMTNPRMKKDQ